MNPNELTDEQKEKLKSCKDSSELKSMLNYMGVEMSDEQLEAASGGDSNWEKCDTFEPPCPRNYSMTENKQK